jgi:hypothetical protein
VEVSDVPQSESGEVARLRLRNQEAERMSHEPPCTTELEIQRLHFLDALKARPLTPWTEADHYCAYCGFRPRAGQPLCEMCEGRRQMLATRYPEAAADSRKKIEARAAERPTKRGGFTPTKEISVREWLPYKS